MNMFVRDLAERGEMDSASVDFEVEVPLDLVSEAMTDVSFDLDFGSYLGIQGAGDPEGPVIFEGKGGVSEEEDLAVHLTGRKARGRGRSMGDFVRGVRLRSRGNRSTYGDNGG